MEIGSPSEYIKTNQLRYFVAVAHAGSIVGGAKLLNISQPPLTTRIKELESILGTKLFNRTKNGVTLTLSGERFLTEAKLALAQNHQALRSAKANSEKRQFYIGILGWILWNDMSSNILGRYRALNPLSQPIIKDFGSRRQIDMLREGNLDLSLNRLFKVPSSKDIGASILKRDRLFAAIPSTNKLSKLNAVSLKQLSDEMDLITMDENVSTFNENLVGIHTSYGIVPNIVQTTAELHTALALVSNGFGYSIFPETLKNRQWPGLRFIPIMEPLPELLLTVLWPKYNLHPQAKVFINFVENEFGLRSITKFTK
jgi:DNA-binding transcriptional LysR family regulator